jgi:aspartyl-tRNA(Asn)/glutamyl-tRNA(Gln) amidotransferase subunit A
MVNIVSDPLADGGIERFGQRLRAGEISSEAVTRAYLERIAVLDPLLSTFEYVAEQEGAAYRARDRCVARGRNRPRPAYGSARCAQGRDRTHDMPTTAGSVIDVSDLVG